MNWDEYVEAALRTAPDQTTELQLVQAALGICGELSELKELDGFDESPETDELRDEFGDLWWYVALAGDALRELAPEWRDVVPIESRRNLAVVIALDFAESVESFVFQEDTSEETIRALVGNWREFRRWLEENSPSEVETIWEQNIAKLRDRHPDGPPS